MSDEYVHFGRRNLSGVATGSPPGGAPRLRTPKAYPCPKCGAPAGQPCRRWIGARVCGADVGGGHWRSLKTLHAERRVKVPAPSP